jgi:hypothetical protein
VFDWVAKTAESAWSAQPKQLQNFELGAQRAWQAQPGTFKAAEGLVAGVVAAAGLCLTLKGLGARASEATMTFEDAGVSSARNFVQAQEQLQNGGLLAENRVLVQANRIADEPLDAANAKGIVRTEEQMQVSRLLAEDKTLEHVNWMRNRDPKYANYVPETWYLYRNRRFESEMEMRYADQQNLIDAGKISDASQIQMKYRDVLSHSGKNGLTNEQIWWRDHENFKSTFDPTYVPKPESIAQHEPTFGMTQVHYDLDRDTPMDAYKTQLRRSTMTKEEIEAQHERLKGLDC